MIVLGLNKMDLIKNRLFWFGLTMFLGGIEMTFNIINHEKGTKLNFGDGQVYMGYIFIVIGIVSLVIDFYNKRKIGSDPK